MRLKIIKTSGDAGADILKGSSGNDIIIHGFINAGTDPDGRKDTIDCGTGTDEAFINTSDGDTAASDCETVHAG